MSVDSVTSPRAGRLETAVVAVGAAALVVGYALPGGAYDTVVRGQFAVAVWWALALGFVTGLLPRARPSRWWVPASAGAMLLALLTVLSFRTTSSDERTASELARVLHHTGILVLVACTVRRATAPAAMGGLIAGAGLVCLAALGVRLFPGTFAEDEVHTAFAGLTRLSYPFDYWNAVGAFAAMTAAASLAMGAHVPHRGGRALAAAPLPLALVVAYLTYSRATVVGVVAGGVAVLALSRHRGTAIVHAVVATVGVGAVVLVIRAHAEIANATGGAGGDVVAVMAGLVALACAAVGFLTARFGFDERLRIPRRAAAVGLVLATVAFIVAGATAGPDLASRAWESFMGPQQIGTADPSGRLTSLGGTRRHLYASALEAGRAHPWSGVGPGTFEFWWSVDARHPEFVRDAHSLYLEAFAELGWPGLGAVSVLVLGLAGAGLRNRAKFAADGRAGEVGAAVAGLAVLCVFAVQAGVDWLWESTACAVLALLAGGAVVAARQMPRPGRRVTGRSVLVRGSLALVAVLVALVQLPTLVSTNRLRASQEAVAAGRFDEAASAVTDAVEAQPWAAGPYAQRALMAERAGDLAAAKADLRRSIEREPDNWRYRLLLARVLAERGETRRAIRAFRRARALRPLAAEFAHQPGRTP